MINAWRRDALESVKEEMEVLIQQTCSTEYGRLMRKVSFSQIAMNASYALFTAVI